MSALPFTAASADSTPAGPPAAAGNAHAAYYADQRERSNPEFWSRFGAIPDVAGKRILDLGCGHGALSVELASRGAKVLGVDLDEARIAWAASNAGELVDFVCADVATLEGEFDLILSKDTFEHVADVAGLLGELRRLLAPDGQLWVGFAPLYKSPWGDHGRTGLRAPWAHAVLPRRVVFALASRHRGKAVRSLHDLKLNGITPREFRRCVDGAELKLQSVSYNRGGKRLLRILGALRRIPALESLATVSIYAILTPASIEAPAPRC